MRLSALCAGTLLLAGVAAPRDEKHAIRLEEVYPKEGQIYDSPWHQWVRNHDLLIQRVDGGLDVVDGLSGTHRRAVDASKALASLAAVGGPRWSELPEPLEVAENGGRVLYGSDSRYWLLDLEKSAFTALTGVPSDAKDLRFAPSGDAIAFVSKNDLYVLPLLGSQPRRLTTTGSDTILNGTLSWVYWEEIFNREDSGYWWSADSKSIAYLRSDDSPVGVAEFVGFEPQVPTIIRQRYPKAGTANPKVSVQVADVATGASHPVSIPSSDYEYVVGVKWSDGKLLVQTMNRKQTVADVYSADASTGSATRINQEEDPKWIDVEQDFRLLNGGKSFIRPSARSGYTHLYRYDLSGELLNAVTSGEWQIDWSDCKAIEGVDEANDWIYFTGLKESHLQRNIYRVHSDGTGLARISEENGTHSASFSPDAKCYVDEFSTLNTPPTLTLHSADGKELASLWKSPPAALQDVLLEPAQMLEIPAEGFLLPATMRKPHNFEASGKYGCIISIYGGPAAPNVTDAWQYSALEDQFFADMGYIVVHVDPRTATMVSRRVVDEAKGKYYTTPELNDLVAAAKWLKQQRFIDPNRVGIMGWSGGGGNTLNAMCRSTEFKAGIAGAPYVDAMFYDTFYSERLYGLPSENQADYEAMALWKVAKDLHGRLLIMYGTGDDNVHPQNELKFIDSAIQAGKTLDVMVYPMRKHGFGDYAANLHRLKTQAEFWKQNL